MAVAPKIFNKRFTAAYLKSSQLLSRISTDTAGSSWLIYQGKRCWWEREWNMWLSLKSILACCSDKHAVFIFFLLLRLNALTKSKLGRGSGESLFGLYAYHWGKSGRNLEAGPEHRPWWNITHWPILRHSFSLSFYRLQKPRVGTAYSGLGLPHQSLIKKCPSDSPRGNLT